MTTFESDQSLPSPDLTDIANGPAAFAALIGAEVDKLVKVYESAADRAARDTTPAEGEISYLKDLDLYYSHTGSGYTELVPKQPSCIARLDTAQSIPDAASTLVTFNAEEFDNGAMFAAPSTTITIQAAGVYLIDANIAFAINATGIRIMDILVNGTLRGGDSKPSIGSGTPTTLSAAVTRLCAQGDTVQMRVFQNSGGSLNAEGAGWHQGRLAVTRVSQV